jgi:hypothetical protein
MPNDIVEVRVLGGYRLFLRFEDGVEGEVDIAEVIPFEGVFARLRERTEFQKVFVDPEWGTICWPGNLDLAPEPLYERLALGHVPGPYPAGSVQSSPAGVADSRPGRDEG